MDRERFRQGTSGFIRGRIVDRDSNPVDVVDLISATLTLYDIDTYSDGSPVEGIINERDHQDILPIGSPSALNDVVYEDDGYFEWTVTADDNIIVTPRRQIERHRAVFRFAWLGGELTFPVEIDVEAVR